MKTNILILGGGMVGSAIAIDLNENGHRVTVADFNEDVKKSLINDKIDFIKIDFTNYHSLKTAINSYDFIIGAVPGNLGYEVLKNVIESKKHIVDISFMPENSKRLDEMCKNNGVIAITDAGVAPGLSNLLFGKKIVEYEKLESAKCYVGGLPQKPEPPWLYKTVFSPIDVIEEYTRPARLVENGKHIVKPAMTDIETLYFCGIGELDAFNSDGLRSLLDLPINNMVEKTLRFPGHVQKIIKMKNSGLLESDKIENTSKTLFSEWASNELDYDQTILRLEFSGIKNNQKYYEKYDLIDFYDKKNKISSMARTTGYTCTAVVKILLDKKITKPGIYHLEKLGEDNNIVKEILNYLNARKIKFDNKV